MKIENEGYLVGKKPYRTARFKRERRKRLFWFRDSIKVVSKILSLRERLCKIWRRPHRLFVICMHKSCKIRKQNCLTYYFCDTSHLYLIYYLTPCRHFPLKSTSPAPNVALKPKTPKNK